MVTLPRWQRILILAVMALGLLYVWPNFAPESWRQSVPEGLPNEPISLGLDLRGGSYLLMEADFGELEETRLDDLRAQVFVILREAKVGFQNLFVRDGGVVFQLRDTTKAAETQALLSEQLVDVVITVDAAGAFSIDYAEGVLESDRGRTLSQAIEIVRRRIDETGTREPSIQQQGDNRILVQLPGVDNPEEIKSLLGTTARLTFHLVREEVRPGVDPVPVGATLLPMEQLGVDGKPVMLAVDDRVVVAGEQLEDAQLTFDQGLPVVSFRFDGSGGKLFCDATSANSQRLLAIVLDQTVISAPRIDEPICGGSGIIRGNFTQESARDLALLLRAGALPVKLNYIEERTIGPGLGADSIAAGEIASVVGVILVVVFMWLAYGLFGLFANLALLFNLALLLAAMTAIGATLTLPGIAGIALTMGMAVDANVLIFERMREEARAGRNPTLAIDAGYKRAISTILDSNLTTLIAALLLFQFGTGPIKGFAVTLSLGLLTSMFTAIMVTRWMVVLWLRAKKRTALPIG